MMKRKGEKQGPTTAKEFMDELASDPEYQRAIEEKRQASERHRLHVAKLEAPIIAELQAKGCSIPSLSFLVNKDVKLSPEIADILISWMRRTENNAIAELLVRPLAATKFPIPGAPLAELFDRFDDDDALRWATTNTMAEAKLTGIEDWLCRRFPDRSLGSARQRMATAVAKHVPKERALPLLRDALDDMPGHVAMALRWVGEREDVERMKEIRDDVKTWERREIDKAIKRIEKRLAKKG